MRTDAELVEAYAREGDEEAFRQLVERHAGMVLRVCRRRLGPGPDAEDAAQAAFLVLMKKAGGLRRKKRVAAWLHGVARNISLRMARSRRNRKSRERQYAMNAEAQRAEKLTDEERTALSEELDAGLAGLSEKQREAVILRYLEGRSIIDAARLAGCSTTALTTRASDGLARLRKHLARRKHILELPALVAMLGQEAHLASQVGAGFSAALASTLTSGAAAGAGASATVAVLAQAEVKLMLIKKIVVAVCAALAVVTGTSTAVIVAQGDEVPAAVAGASLVEVRAGKAGRQEVTRVRVRVQGEIVEGTVAYSQLRVEQAVDGQGREMEHSVGNSERYAAMFGTTEQPVPLWSGVSRVHPVPGEESVDVTLVLNNPDERPETIRSLAGALRLLRGTRKEVTVELGLADAGHVDVPELAAVGLKLNVRHMQAPEGDRNGMAMLTIDGVGPASVAGATLENPGEPQAIRTFVDGRAGTMVITASGEVGPDTVLRLELVEDVSAVDVSFELEDIDVPREKQGRLRGVPDKPRLHSGGTARGPDGDVLALLNVDIPTDLALRATAVRDVTVTRATDQNGFKLTFRRDAMGLSDYGVAVPVLAHQAPVVRSWGGKALRARLPFLPPGREDAETVDISGVLEVLVAAETQEVVLGELEQKVGEEFQNEALREAGLALELTSFARPEGAGRLTATVKIWGKLANVVDVRLESDAENFRAMPMPRRQRNIGDDLVIRFVSDYEDDLRLVLAVATELDERKLTFEVENGELPAAMPTREKATTGAPPDSL